MHLAGSGLQGLRATCREWEELQRCRVDRRVVAARLGTMLLANGELGEAIEQLQSAIRGQPDVGEVHVNLGVALAQEGRLAEAVVHFRRAVELDPEDGKAQRNLAAAQKLLGE